MPKASQDYNLYLLKPDLVQEWHPTLYGMGHCHPVYLGQEIAGKQHGDVRIQHPVQQRVRVDSSEHRRPVSVTRSRHVGRYSVGQQSRPLVSQEKARGVEIHLVEAFRGQARYVSLEVGIRGNQFRKEGEAATQHTESQR